MCLRLLFSLNSKEMVKMRLLAIWIGQRLSFKIAKNIDISYTERDFETERIHLKWVCGDAKTFKSFFLETILISKL